MLFINKRTLILCKIWAISIYLALFCVACGYASQSKSLEQHSFLAASVQFDWFQYVGDDKEFAVDLKPTQYINPVLPGYHPDPSITRAGDDFYLVNSSFGHWPGLPIFHSTDLVHWQQIGHALTRSDQLDFEGIDVGNDGIYAPTLRYHEGVFYLITTAVRAGGNFLMTAKNPAGPWSDPVFLPEINGIDPDIFFDDDGKTYIAHNGGPEGEPLYSGHRAIWLWEYDLANKRVVAESGRIIVDGGVDISKKPIWIEGPHIYKVGDWYYLTCAEGGTGPGHSQVIFRTKSVTEPFVPYENNPILSQRDLPRDRPFPISNAGHADFIQTKTGEWWAVFLGSRIYDGEYTNLGRETYLLPVKWQNEWPVILTANTAIPYVLEKPKGLTDSTQIKAESGNFTWRDDFASKDFALTWKALRGPWSSWSSIDSQQGLLNVKAKSDTLLSKKVPAFLARPQQHQNFSVSTKLKIPQQSGISGGLAALQNSRFHYYWGVRRQENSKAVELFLEKTEAGNTKLVSSSLVPVSGDWLILELAGNNGELHFYYQTDGSQSKTLVKGQDARILSTQKAGGFVGTYLGLHARVEPQGALQTQ